jgi:hypothetical protein
MGRLKFFFYSLLSLKKEILCPVIWIFLVSFLSLITYNLYKKELQEQKKEIFSNLQAYEVFFEKKLNEVEKILNLSSKSFLKEGIFKEDNFDLLIFDSNKNFIISSHKNLPIFPLTESINNKFLISELSSTSLWATFSQTSSSMPSLYFLEPKIENNKISNYFLFWCPNLEKFLNPIFEESKKFGFNNYCYICKNGFKTASKDRNSSFIPPKEILETTLSGEKSIFIKKQLFDSILYAGFYNPDLAISIIFSYNISHSPLFIFLFIGTLGLFLFGIVSWLKNKDNFALIFFLISFFVCIFFATQSLLVKNNKQDYSKWKLFFENRSSQLLINQSFERYKSFLDNLELWKFQLNLSDDEIKNEVSKSGVYAAVFYQKTADKFEFQTISNTDSWQPPNISVNQFTNDISFAGPINDPTFGKVFFALKWFQNKNVAILTVFDTSTITSVLENIWQNYKAPLLLKNSEGSVIYSFGDFDENKTKDSLYLSAPDWTLEVQKAEFNFSFFNEKVFNQFIYSFLLFLLVSLFFFAEKFFNFGVFSKLNFAIIVSLILLTSYIIYASWVVKRYVNKLSTDQIQNWDKLKNEIEITKAYFRLNQGSEIKELSVKLDVKMVQIEGASKFNLRGLIEIGADEIKQIDIWTATPSILNLNQEYKFTPYNLDFTSKSNLAYFPLNPMIIKIPLNIYYKNNIILVPDYDNLYELNNLKEYKINLINVGARYVYEEENNVPQLEYIFIFERSLINSIVSFIVPLIIAVSLLYQGFLLTEKDSLSLGFIAIWGSVLFTIVLIHSNYRKYVEEISFSFLENFFYATFIFIILVQGVFIGSLKEKENALFLRKFYFLGWLFIVSLFIYNSTLFNQ